MSQILQIAWREYKQYVFSRGFLLFLIMFPAGILLGGFAAGFSAQGSPARHYVVFDQVGGYAEAIDREIEDRYRRNIISTWDTFVRLTVDDALLDAEALPEPFAPGPITSARVEAFFEAGGADAGAKALAPYLNESASAFTLPERKLLRISLPGDVARARDTEEAIDLLRPYLLGERAIADQNGEPVTLFAALLIPENYGSVSPAPASEGGEQADGETVKAEYWSRNLTDESLSIAIERALRNTLKRKKIEQYGLSEAVFDDIEDTRAEVSSFRPDRDEEDAELGLRDSVEVLLPGALTYMLVVVIFGIGNLLLTNTIEERSNKIVEVLLSSVTAEQLMLGKLIGIGAVGLTLPSVFVVGGVLTAVLLPASSDLMGGVVETLFATPLFIAYLFYFFCAYSIFSMIFLAIGAISNSLQDAQSYMGPVTLLIFAPLPFVPMMYQNPNGAIASILTWIPIYTPYAVLLRAASDPPLWEIVGATALMLAFAWFLARIMGRIFRNAILQASPPKMRDIFRLAGRS